MNKSEIIKEHILREFVVKKGVDDIGIEDSLLNSGIIDSTAIFEIIIFLESSFGVEVSDEEIIPDNFETIKNIIAFIESKTDD
jgi:acyl carrier protein